MATSGIKPTVSEYHILWEALTHYEMRLEKQSSMTTEEDQQLKYDEKSQNIDGLLTALKLAAQADYSLNLE
jgi:hypothetical protein